MSLWLWWSNATLTALGCRAAEYQLALVVAVAGAMLFDAGDDGGAAAGAGRLTVDRRGAGANAGAVATGAVAAGAATG
ncbi:MAG: hypothetical protein LH465_08025, partial [Sphingomonas bacterium]|nr:hypothetical protein [Sphingomonas bacterium]